MESSGHHVTQLLKAWGNGDPGAFEQLVSLVYDELHRLARRYMAQERPGHTLQTTALVNEAYLRLVDSTHATWQNRTQFFAICAQLMRRILVDWARARQSLKRGGEDRPLELEEALVIGDQPGEDLVALDDALKELAALDPRKSKVVELRFFGGLSVEESAEVLKVSVETVMRDWKFAKTWLRRELSRESGARAVAAISSSPRPQHQGVRR